MNFSKNLNRLVTVGFVISVIASLIIATYLTPRFAQEQIYELGVWLAIVAVGLIISILIWGFIGTITEIGIATQRICEILEGSNKMEVCDNGGISIRDRMNKLIKGAAK